MNRLPLLLPCNLCNKHLAEHLRKYPPDASSGTSLSKYMRFLHRQVDLSLGKIPLSDEEGEVAQNWFRTRNWKNIVDDLKTALAKTPPNAMAPHGGTAIQQHQPTMTTSFVRRPSTVTSEKNVVVASPPSSSSSATAKTCGSKPHVAQPQTNLAGQAPVAVCSGLTSFAIAILILTGVLLLVVIITLIVAAVSRSSSSRAPSSSWVEEGTQFLPPDYSLPPPDYLSGMEPLAF